MVKDSIAEIKNGHFDLVWLPPPSYAGKYSAGYGPKEYFNLNNSYGSFRQQHQLLKALLKNGIEPVADIVINHRDGTNGWTNFTRPAWNLSSICRSDEAFSNAASGVANTPISQRGADEETPEYAGGSTTYAYNVFRDIDHTNKQVRADVLRYLLQLKSAGYRGWRYDMVHGYHAKWIALYNAKTAPTFSVGEYDWDKQGEQRGWIWHSATTQNQFTTSSSVFDFSTYNTLKENKGNYEALYFSNNGLGLMGDNTDGLPWKQKAVTFLENHDTGFRTNDDGTHEEGHEFDNFTSGWQVEQAYAYILTHPGVPCVYWKHYFQWGYDLHNKIKALTNARKVAGVNAGSTINTQNNARLQHVYAAMITGTKGELYVRIGGSDANWQPNFSNYRDYREYAAGAGWKVWIKLPGNPVVQQAALHQAFEVPVYTKAETIDITTENVP